MGHVDVWVENAMATVFAPVWDTTAEEYRRVTDVTNRGDVHGTLAALRRMRPQPRIMAAMGLTGLVACGLAARRSGTS